MLKQSEFESLKNHIDKQFAFNRGKNLFFKDLDRSVRFDPFTPEAITQILHLDNESETLLLDYLTDKVTQEFCRVNQYYSIDERAQNKLRIIYRTLLRNVKNVDSTSDNSLIRPLIQEHFNKLKSWLIDTNSFSEALYSVDKETVDAVACAEYSAELQIDLFNIHVPEIGGPLLDIGCGKEGHLVAYLRLNGIEACGIDRFNPKRQFLDRSDWQEYNYGINKWGTIISHLSFSNHFSHHHKRSGGNFIGYASKYMSILNSLKIGGIFYYAPNLPFIEQYLEESEFHIQIRRCGNSGYKSAKITRLK